MIKSYRSSMYLFEHFDAPLENDAIPKCQLPFVYNHMST